jgi:anaerobic selenocysteine-containing dehydrogenase
MTAGLTPPLAGIGEDGRHLYTCPLCEAMCGLEIQVDGGRVASIRGNRDDTWSRGHICPKGATLGALHEDTDRIRRPMIKVDGHWHEVSWDAAFRRCTELLAPDREVRHRGGDVLHRKPARALLLTGPLHRGAAGHVGHPAVLLTGHRRPVAEEPVVASDVRRMVELPRSPTSSEPICWS